MNKLTALEIAALRRTRVELSLKQLTHEAELLNSASDILQEAITVIESRLKKMNLGIAAWHKCSGAKTHSEYLGYAKFNGRWGIGIKTVPVDPETKNEDHSNAEIWPFAAAPRYMRIDHSTKIPELLEVLVERAQEMTERLGQRKQALDEVIAVMNEDTEISA